MIIACEGIKMQLIQLELEQIESHVHEWVDEVNWVESQEILQLMLTLIFASKATRFAHLTIES